MFGGIDSDFQNDPLAEVQIGHAQFASAIPAHRPELFIVPIKNRPNRDLITLDPFDHSAEFHRSYSLTLVPHTNITDVSVQIKC